MKKKELLKQIARTLDRLQFSDMTWAERRIAELLIKEGYGRADSPIEFFASKMQKIT